jgi:hypothetical protein
VPLTTVAPEHRVHRFLPSDGTVVTTVMWCQCGQQHPVSRTVHSCTSCPFVISLPLGGGHP